MRRYLSALLPLLALFIACGSATQIMHYTQEYPKRCLSTVTIIDTLDPRLAVARLNAGDTIYVVGLVTKSGGDPGRYLVRYHNEVGVISSSEGLVEADAWEPPHRQAVAGDSARSVGAPSSVDASGRTVYTGPRGGRYYYNSKGNKTYVKKK